MADVIACPDAVDSRECRVSWCTRPVTGYPRTRLCNACWKWSNSNGGADPESPKRRISPGTVQKLIAEAAQATHDRCIVLRGRKTGRRVVRYRGTMMQATRAVVWQATGNDPGELHVLHTCNGGSGAHGCINIRHLQLGTHRQNMKDKTDAERQARGERHGDAKLTDAQVEYIRAVCVPGDAVYNVSALARRFNVARSTIRNALKGRTWKHVE